MCVYVCVCMCMYVCVCVYIYIYIYIYIYLILTVQTQILPDHSEEKCCIRHRVPAELPDFRTVYRLAMGRRWETGTYLGPKSLTSPSDRPKCAGTYPPFHLSCSMRQQINPETRYL